MFDVTALGELLIDFTHLDAAADAYPVMAAHPGGAPANFLATLAKFGAKTAMLAKVGDDAFGHMLTATLHSIGIETRGVRMTGDAFTTLAFVTLDDTGNRTFSFARKPGADTQLQASELDRTLIEESRIVHFGSLSLTHEPARTATYEAIAYAGKLDKLITFDPNLRIPLWADLGEAKEQMLWGLSQADVVKISDEEVDFLFGLDPQAGARHIIAQYNVKLVFVTCGARGCWFETPIARGHVDAPRGICAVDTTGAGDIFGGAAVWKLLQCGKRPESLTDAELHDITRFACTAASLSATKPGGISAVPDYDEVCSLMNKEN